jgi:prepilin-type N-terminal cleavage/methylation domain-containing protein
MKSGVTLTELMVAVAVISIGILGAVGSFKYLNQGIQTAKGKSLANNLAQEKIEVLKNKSYYRVLVTTVTREDTNFSPSFFYDTGPNGTENINVGGINFERRVYIRKVTENASGSLTYLDWDERDPGLKEILVYVVWKEGNTWKKTELRNLRENPDRTSLSVTFKGNVQYFGINIEGVTVKAQENPARYGITDSNGNYSFAIEPGSYTLRASKTGYFPKTSSLLDAPANQPVTQHFTLTKMSSGTIVGTVYTNDHLVLSEIAAKINTLEDLEYVELYNSTTYTWTINDSTIKLKYIDGNNSVSNFPALTYNTSYVQPNKYYLVASSPTVLGITPDAYYTATQDKIVSGTNGGVALTDSYGIGIDSVAWGNPGLGNPPPTNGREGAGLVITGVGPSNNETLERKASSTSVETSMDTGGVQVSSGNAYDSNRNENDWVHHAHNHVTETSPVPIQNTLNSEIPVSGTPAQDAIIYVDDGLSNLVIADSAGNFSLTSVATGYWTVYASSGVVYSSVAYYGGTTDGYISSVGNIYLTTTAICGYVSGKVTNVSNIPLGNILIHCIDSVQDVRTNSQGNYLIPILPSTGTIYANYQTDNSNYVEASSDNVVIYLGQIAKNVDFVLSEGGKLRGWVTTNDVDALPNVPVIAFKNNINEGEGISGSDGYFDITRLSTGTYVVSPQLDAGETAIPSTFTKTLAAGDNLFVGTFTVSGAMGYITGTVTLNSITGPAITTGVLIYATTTTITSDPPTINSTLRSGSKVYYAVSSNAQGQYILPVRGGYTYNIYAWYTTWNGEVPSTARKNYTGVAVSAGETVTRKFFW